MDKVTRFLCARRLLSTIVETRAQLARRARPALPQQGNMNQGQAAPQAQPAAPPAQPAAAAAPPVLPAPQAPLPVPPAPPAFALGPGRSHAILNFLIPTLAQRAPSYTTKQSLPSRPSSTEKRTTWQSSWPAYAIGQGASTGTGSSPCLSTMAQQGICSRITAKYPWTTPGHTRPPM